MNPYLISTFLVPMITFVLRTMGNCRRLANQINQNQFIKIKLYENNTGITYDIPIPSSYRNVDVLTMRNIERLIYSNTDFPYTFYLFQKIPFYLEVISSTSKGEIINRIVSSQRITENSSLIVFPLLNSKQVDREPDTRGYVQVSLKTSQNKEVDITDYINRYRLCSPSIDIKLKQILDKPEYYSPQLLKVITLEDLEEIDIEGERLNEFRLGELFSGPNLSSGRKWPIPQE